MLLEGCRWRHHIAVDITTCRQGGAHVADDRAHHGAEILFRDAVQLEGLARCGSDAAVAVLIGEIVERQIELGRDASSGAAQAQHHSPVFGFAFAPVIAIVLLIAAVKLEDLNRIVGEIRKIVLQLGGQGFAQVAAIDLELFELAALSRFLTFGRNRHD